MLLSKLFWVLLCAGFFFLAVRFLEFRSIFYPAKNFIAFPPEYGLKFEDVYFETADGKKLNGWFLPAGETSKVVLFCHGNAGNISYRIEKLVFLNRMGLGVFIFDYRGYGKSGGRPGEQGFYRDAAAAYDHLRSRGIPGERIVGYGESIGGAVIAKLAADRPMSAVIFENAFTNVKDMVRVHLPAVPHWLLASRFDAKEKVAFLKVPKLIMQSKHDEIVPATLGAALFEAAAGPKEFLELRGGHNDGFFESEDLIEPALRDFLART